MKKIAFAIVLMIIGIANSLAQNVPQGMNYQAILQDSKGPISGKAVDLRLSILDGSNNILYQETFSKFTELNGGISTVIGSGNVQSGTFAGINWGAGDRYLKVEVNVGGAGYQTYGSNVKFQSVPYALYSLNPGPKGDKGDKGDAGLPGAPGAAGKDGVAGKDGAAGKDGVAGKDGAAGSANINGTTDYLVKFTGSTSGGNSIIYDNGTQVSIGTTSPTSGNKLEVNTAGTNFDAINGITSGNFVGVYGEGDGSSSSGVYGKNLASDGTGVFGAGNSLSPVRLTSGTGGAFTGDQYGVFALSKNTSTTVYRAGGYFSTDASGSYAIVGAMSSSNVARKIEGNGTVNTVVKNTEGKQVLLSAIETPENIFTDYGSGKLTNGTAHIVLDPNFAKNIIVNEKHPLRVFIQLEGDCNGVFVTGKSGTGFDVVELMKGSSDVAFSWTVVANRADEIFSNGIISRYSDERFAPAMGILPTQKVLTGK
jgi:hypothetical protein